MITLEDVQSLGLDEKTAKIYLASLQNGVVSIQKLAEIAGIKRPTAYLHVQALLKEGLLEKVPMGKKEYFQATTGSSLKTKVTERLMQMQTLIPKLEELQNQNLGKPNVSVLIGKKGLEQIYKEIAEASTIRFWTDLSQFEKTFQKMFDELSQSIKEKQIRTKEIITDSPEAKRSSRRYASTAGKHYSSRISTKPGIQNDSAVFGNTVALFRIQDLNLFCVRIEDSSIAETTKAMFDMAWDSATPYIN